MVWYGTVWYGMVWCGVVWCGVEWSGLVWYGMVWYDVVSCQPSAFKHTTCQNNEEYVALCLIVLYCVVLLLAVV